MTSTQNTSTDTSVIASITMAVRESKTESIAQAMLHTAIYNYRSETKKVAQYATYVAENMKRIAERCDNGERVYDSDATSWYSNLQESIVARQAAADKIKELAYMLGVDKDEAEAMWVEIESGVK